MASKFKFNLVNLSFESNSDESLLDKVKHSAVKAVFFIIFLVALGSFLWWKISGEAVHPQEKSHEVVPHPTPLTLKPPRSPANQSRQVNTVRPRRCTKGQRMSR